MSSRLLAAAVLGAVLVATGCASIPDTGPVEAGKPVVTKPPGALRLIPLPPRVDAEPEELIRGFIDAMATADPEQLIQARKYLTPAMSEQWRPDSGLTIYSGERTITQLSRTENEASFDVTVTPVAQIGEGGRYGPPADAAAQKGDYSLTRVGGQWRLSSVPNGLLVSQASADQALDPYRVYFVDARGSYLVPDVRWFPAQKESAKKAVQAIFDGPASQLANSVQSVPDLQLGTGGVVVRDGVATVDLALPRPAARQLALLREQLRATLTGLPEIRDVRITVDGTLVTASSAELDAAPETEPVVVNRQPYVLLLPPAKPDQPAAETPSAAESQPAAETQPAGESQPAAPSQAAPTGPAPPGATESATADATAGADRPAIVVANEFGDPTAVPSLDRLAAAIDHGLTASPVDPWRFAGVSPDRSTIWASTLGGSAKQAIVGVDLIAPSFDPQGWLWTVSREAQPGSGAATGGSTILATSDSGDSLAVSATFLEATDRVTTLRISRDGTRALLVVEGADADVSVRVAGVARDQGGQPRSLSPSTFSVLPDLVTAKDATWVSGDTVAVLGSSDAGGEARAFVAQVGGVAESPLPVAAGAMTIAAGAGERTIVLGLADGHVVSRVGNSWSSEPRNGLSPTF